MTTDMDSQLSAQRAHIDEIDGQIVALLNQRIAAARRIGEIKAAHDQNKQNANAKNFYHPAREAQILKRLRELNPGPLDNAAMENLFREIISICRAQEASLSVAILGPPGTYTEVAARQHFGHAVKVVAYSTIGEIFWAAETGQTDFAVAPVENSTEGGVNATLDRLETTSLIAGAEINLRIQHNLLGQSDVANIKTVAGHAQALAQCKLYLDRNLPTADCAAVASTAAAAEMAAVDKKVAAIGGAAAAAQYNLSVIATGIEDQPGNTTRFLVFSNRPTPPSGDDKTSLLLSCRNRPGALLHLLKPLHGIDMTRLESRPSKTGLWAYVFFVDIIGHQEDPQVAAALAQLKAEAGWFKNLGSYPIAS